MVQFSATISKFGAQGEKTGWTYILIPANIARKLKPGNKKSFRVKGKLDEVSYKSVALLPMGDGDFIMALNAGMRKSLCKTKGATIKVQMEVDNKPLSLSPELMDCLQDEPEALAFFQSLAKSHQGYFSKWIDSAKTEQTRARRIAQTISALLRHFGFPEMLRALKQDRNDRLP